MTTRPLATILPLVLALAACRARPPTAPSAASSSSQTTKPTRVDTTQDPKTPASSALSPPLDEKAIAQALGLEEVQRSPDGTIKGTFARTDVAVSVDGWKMPPFMGLTSWAAFAPAKAGVAEAMVMGDLVLFEDEVNPVMSVLFDGGLTVTALHNHFFMDTPKVYFLHVGGEGTPSALGKTVRLAIDKATEIRKKAGKIVSSFGGPALPAKSNIDSSKVEAFLGTTGESKDGMFKITLGRQVSAACGCPAGKAMGVATWAAFAGTDDVALVDGDFAVTENELQPVLKSLRGNQINIVAIHHHMSGESPRMLFVHYWGRGRVADLAASLKEALAFTKVDAPPKQP